MIVYKKTDEWYIELRVTANYNELYITKVLQRVTASNMTGDTSGTTSNNEQVTISAIFSFFQIREKPIAKHPKENSLNLEEDLRRGPTELQAEERP